MLLAACVATFAFIAISDVTSLDINLLKLGEYYKPCNSEASGLPNTNANFRRSPCPALNSLANGGYLPRNGQDITKDSLKNAVVQMFNMADEVATNQVRQAPDGVFALNELSKPGLEHDASLVRDDAYFGHDPMVVNLTLANDLIKRADTNGMISTAAIAAVRRDRATFCMTSNPRCQFGDSEKGKSFTQAALLLLSLGVGDAISVEAAWSFLVDEKIPSNYVKPAKPVTLNTIRVKSAELVALAA
ncbi:unnamed protein product [Peronospora belbahrii]|uniref:Heme haloperoxidase family profile domain-containing protein n=1 Tax=Peronospora belbahrii TaxID=622444 RepID=A0AAU9KW75_9STRA|nr:unnamed protein product [Peronospora belbahrii]